MKCVGIIARSPARARSGQRQPRNYLQDWVYLAACLAIPAVMAAAWYAIRAVHLPPGGPAGPWVALLLAALFGVQSVLALILVGFSLTKGHGEDPAARPVRYLLRQGAIMIVAFCVVNAPLTVCLAGIRALALYRGAVRCQKRRLWPPSAGRPASRQCGNRSPG